MVTTRIQKRAAQESSSPLRDPALLSLVLTFVGAGEWLYTAAVRRQWKEMYSLTDTCEAADVSYNDNLGQLIVLDS